MFARRPLNYVLVHVQTCGSSPGAVNRGVRLVRRPIVYLTHFGSFLCNNELNGDDPYVREDDCGDYRTRFIRRNVSIY